MAFRVGFLMNPVAGLGGPVALKGSDGVAARALALGGEPRVAQRARRALAGLLPLHEGVEMLTWGDPMGAGLVAGMGFRQRVIGCPGGVRTDAVDTRQAAAAMAAEEVDLLLFAGGDGTARDLIDAGVGQLPVLGIPAGVKMHSGVFALSPEAAGEVLGLLVRGALVDLRVCEVRDLDEEALRQGRVGARYYGELLAPEEGRFVQHVKQGGREVESLVLADIAAEILQRLEDDVLYIVGPGSTTAALLEQRGLAPTLMGVDLLLGGELIASDASAAEIEARLDTHPGGACIITTVTGGQGSLFGRGNQQISAGVIARVGRDHLWLVATKSKLRGLEGRPLVVDTGDPALDRRLRGYYPVITGYRDQVLYPVNTSLEPLAPPG